MHCVTVLMTVSTETLQSPAHLRMLDGSSLSAHLNMVRGRLALGGASCKRSELDMRCVAKVLLQTAPQLVTVRAPRRRATPLPACWYIAAPVLAWTGSSCAPCIVTHAVLHCMCFGHSQLLHLEELQVVGRGSNSYSFRIPCGVEPLIQDAAALAWK